MKRRSFLKLLGTAALAMSIGLPRACNPQWEIDQVVRMLSQTMYELWVSRYRDEYLKLAYQWDRPWYNALHRSARHDTTAPARVG